MRSMHVELFRINGLQTVSLYRNLFHNSNVSPMIHMIIDYIALITNQYLCKFFINFFFIFSYKKCNCTFDPEWIFCYKKYFFSVNISTYLDVSYLCKSFHQILFLYYFFFKYTFILTISYFIFFSVNFETHWIST